MAAEYLESPLLRAAGFRHAFFTRRGGVSQAPYESLNFSVSVGDTPERVDQNLALAAAALGVAPDTIFFLSQVHGSGVEEVTDALVREPNARVRFMNHEADAVLCSVPGVAAAVRTADCVPILVGDLGSGAVLAIHAGWRGVVRGVIEAALERLRPRATAARALLAAIGPHIGAGGSGAFEVGSDVAAELEAVSPDARVVDWTGAKPRVLLGKIVRAKLIALGIGDGQIDDVAGCTFSEPERFFSFRREGRVSGRHLSAIVPRGR